MRATTLLLGLSLLSCSGSPPRFPITDPAMALRALHARDERVQSLRAQGTADHFGAQGRIRGSVYIFVQRPRNLRVDTEAFGNTLSSLISDGTSFTLTDYRSSRFFTGPAEACVAAQLLGIPLESAEVVSVMAGGPPVIDGNPHIHWEHGHYVLDIAGAGGRTESLELEITRAEREGAQPAAQHPLPSRAVLRDARGVRAVITFEDYTVVSEVNFPRRVRVVMERDNVDLLVRYREIEINPDLPASAWSSSAPGGMTTVPVDCADNALAPEDAGPPAATDASAPAAPTSDAAAAPTP